jgi:hypothetical protein
VADYLGKIGRTGRRIALGGLIITAAVSATVNLLVVILLIDPRARGDILGPLIASGLVFGGMTLVSFWMLLSLLRRGRSSNKVTMMPTLFIQGFGLLFTIGIGFAAVKGGQKLFLAEACLIALNMLFLPRLLRRKLSEESGKQ